MNEKPKRNDPCPCGSGKKYKQCCLQKEKPKGRFQFKATALGKSSEAPSKPIDLMERTFGKAIAKAEKEGTPPSPSNAQEAASGESEAAEAAE